MLAAGSRLSGEICRTLGVSTIASQGLHDFIIESQRHRWKDPRREVLQEIDNTRSAIKTLQANRKWGRDRVPEKAGSAQLGSVLFRLVFFAGFVNR
jgi:hypothetical protein